jgi:hypothetical protein
MKTYQSSRIITTPAHDHEYRSCSGRCLITLFAGILMVPLGFFRISTIPLLCALILLLLAPVVTGIWVWRKMFDAADDVLD